MARAATASSPPHITESKATTAAPVGAGEWIAALDVLRTFPEVWMSPFSGALRLEYGWAEVRMSSPIDAMDTVWIEEMTWMETRDAIKAGKTTAIVGTGGLEQNGPYAPNGKHTCVLRATCEAIARTLGNAL